jgi:16S rRNA (guanine527-N7)-methyltransferase
LDLKNVSTQQIRAEDIKGRLFDTVVSRAVAPLKQLLIWSKPLVKKKEFDSKLSRSDLKNRASRDLFPTNGLICLKGGDLAEEISETNSRPLSIEIYEIFREEYFREKFILFVGL